MKILLLSTAAATCLAVPVLAAKIGPCIGPDGACRQLAEANSDYVAAFNKHDPGAVAAFYALDAVFVTEGAILSGREAIQNEYATNIKNGDSNLVVNIAQSKVAGDTAWAYGDWSVQSSGRPLHGNWVTIYDRDDKTWKMRVDTFNIIER
jgi:uncharacterized protein (TIGR02246 family)